MKRLLIILLLLAANARAANVYIRQGAAGTATGADWTNALTQLPDGAFVRGNTYYVADGTYNGFTINTVVSGTTLITVKKATIADHGTSTGWSDAFGDGQAILNRIAITYGYVTIDGVFEYGFYIPVPEGQHGINVGGYEAVVKDAITIKYVDLAGPAGSAALFYTQETVGVYAAWFVVSPYDFTNMLISHCSMHGMTTLNLLAKHNGLIVEYCKLYDVRTSNINGPHTNCVYINSSDNCTFRYNEVSNWDTTGYYMNQWSGTETRTGHKIYGNWFHDSAPGYPGAVYHSWGNQNDAHVHNNTIQNVYSFFSSYNSVFTNSFCSNNILINVTVPQVDISGHNYNYFSGSDALGEANGIAAGSTNPFTTAPAISSSISSVLPRNKGVALAAEYNTDATGATRGGDGTWDIGAREAGGADVTPPTLFSSVINAAGTEITRTFLENVQHGAGGTGGWTITLTGGAITGTYNRGAGTTQLVYTLSRAPLSTETGTDAYVQPGNGVEDGPPALNDLLSLSGFPITNNSVPDVVATPTASPTGGPFFGAQNITLTCATSGSAIRYTTDGSTPTGSSSLYSTPILLSAGTTLKAIGIKAGLTNSAILTEVYEIDLWTSVAAWKNVIIPQATGLRTWSFRVNLSSAVADTVIGAAPNSVGYYTDLAAIVRFNSGGTVDVRNGPNYNFDVTFNYSASTNYDVVMQIDVPNRKVLSVRVNGTLIATNYAFRDEQNMANDLDNFGMTTTVGTTTISNMTWTAPGPPNTHVGTINATNLITK